MTEPEDLERQKESWDQRLARRSISAEQKAADAMARFGRSPVKKKWDALSPILQWVLSILAVFILGAIAAAIVA